MMSTEAYEVILTHEHTDFDALASLFGASLLFPAALPVLPHAMNRNVSSFLALYRNQFPFIRARELPRGAISRAILVDTRNANHPRGMQSDTHYYVIDHHSFDQTTPEEGWEVWSEAVGANTTLIVEKLIARDQALTPVEATLLALGIHEDTGSLTYSNTTHRDAVCLAWLLQPEHGVNLEEIKEFLNHPLSDEQRQLLQTLLDNSTFYDIVGHSVVIAHADAREFSGEISTLAQRLVDFHEQDATFLVINLGDIVQMVARSSTDAIDAGAIARALGGGGHPRAAAAPVHEPDTGRVCNRLVDLLHEYGRAAVTVHHIMSFGDPKTVTPEMTVDEAAEMMRRYGHEGFPVVEANADGIDQLIGVMTRREIDRSLNHNMGALPVRRVMRAGKVSVRPSDSISTLRNLMIRTNWGQIPVVDADERIIGIVTRTDLIKLWGETGFSSEGKAEMDHRLRRVLSATQYALLRWIGAEVDAMNYTVYIVGGYVRDLLLNGAKLALDSLDMDCVVEGDAIAFALRLQAQYGGRVIPHKRFGTAKWLLTDDREPVDSQELHAKLGTTLVERDLPTHLDFVSARTEFYTEPTVLPTVERSSIKLDLLRRDFSINTLAICLSHDRWGDLLDLFGGVHDLETGIIRILHSLSFVDDPTRILRAVRYEQRFGFEIEARTLELLQSALDLLERVSPTRIRHEMERILQEVEPESILMRLDQLGVLRMLHPALKTDERLCKRFVQLRQALRGEQAEVWSQEPIERLYWGVWVQDLPPAQQEELTERFGLRSDTVKLVTGLAALNEHSHELADPALPASRAVALLDRVYPTAIALNLALTENDALRTTLGRYWAEWRHVRAELTGHDLAQMGIPRGPLYAHILKRLRAARLDGDVQHREQEEELVRRITA